MTRPLTARALLDAWERSLDEPAVTRPAVLAAAGAGQPVADVMRWDIGQRDAALFDLRVQLFGPTADAVGRCPSCAARLDVRLDLAVIGPEPVDPAPVAVARHLVHHRLPTTADLMALLAEPDADAARKALVQRALVAVEDTAGKPVPYDGLTEREQAMVAGAIAAAQDGIDVRLALRCDACGHEWVTPFDIGAFLLAELDAWAAGLLREVHVLAETYGWSERDILDLRARRRRAYLDLIGAP
jgi:hypothetical protein